MKVLFVSRYPVEVTSTRYRVHAYLPELVQRRIRYAVFPLRANRAERPGLLTRVRRCGTLLRLSLGSDIVFLHRLVLPRPFLGFLLVLGKRILFDLDSSLHVDKDGHPRPPRFLKGLEYQISVSSRVFAGNSYLKKFASRWNRSVCALPVALDLNAYKPREVYGGRKEIVIGWLGTVAGSEPCLHALETVFDSLAEKYGSRVKLYLVATEPVDVVTRLAHSFQPWNLENEQRSLEAMDIGILPLLGNERDFGWSGFQLVQYMAKGIPVVASAIGVNSEILTHGHTGFLVNDEEEWRTHIGQFIDQEKLREFVGRNARRLVEKRFDIQKNMEVLVDHIQKVARE